jgi:hypothetical protein
MKIILRVAVDYIDGGAIRQIEGTRGQCQMRGVFGAEVNRVGEEICFNTRLRRLGSNDRVSSMKRRSLEFRECAS